MTFMRITISSAHLESVKLVVGQLSKEKTSNNLSWTVVPFTDIGDIFTSMTLKLTTKSIMSKKMLPNWYR